MSTHRGLVFVAGTSFDGVAGSDRHLASALRRYTPVLWVDPPVSPVTPERYRHGQPRQLLPRLREDGGLVRLTPVGLPGVSRSVLRVLTWWLVRLQIRWALRRLGMRPHAVLVASLNDVLGRWGADVLNVFYGTDDYVAGAALMHQNADRMRRDERRQLARADLVLAISPLLRDRWIGMGADPILVLNGVDPDAYSEVDSAPVPSGVDLPDPVVGLVGQLCARIEISLLEAVADSGCSLLLVGPHDPAWQPERFAGLVARSNVSWVGRQPFAALPSYLRLMSVGVTPYQDTPFNRASFPLKTLEYLAAGLPVVSTDLPAVRWLGTDLVGTASDPVSFARAARAAADTRRSPRLVARRRAFAARHSWACRAEQVARAIGLDPLVPAGRTTDGWTWPST